MPYGVHKGKRMCDIPSSYLIWLYENNRCTPAVKQYIESNITSIRKAVFKQHIRSASDSFMQADDSHCGLTSFDAAICNSCMNIDSCKIAQMHAKESNKPQKLRGRYM